MCSLKRCGQRRNAEVQAQSLHCASTGLRGVPPVEEEPCSIELADLEITAEIQPPSVE